MKQISLLGCGWLGFPLAKSLLKNGFLINGSTTTLEKISVLKNEGITPFEIRLLENDIEGDINSFLEHSELLIVDIPPKLRNTSQESFVEKIRTLAPFIEKSSVEKVIFISSTSVYSDTISLDKLTELDIPKPYTESGKQLIDTENLLQNNQSFKTTILRFGGLVGKNRHPINFLTGRKNLENPDAPINLIHQEDCIGIIESVIENDCWNEVFNAVAPVHPTRKAYYFQKAIEFNLPLPEFDLNKPSIGKLIVSDKIESVLHYTFKNKL